MDYGHVMSYLQQTSTESHFLYAAVGCFGASMWWMAFLLGYLIGGRKRDRDRIERARQ